MKTASVKELKIELSERSPAELLDICLKLSRFKKENKELLTYLLFEAENEDSYIASIKVLMDTKFEETTTRNLYYLKKSLRATLKDVKKYIRYSKKTTTEVELLLHFCKKMAELSDTINRSRVLTNMYERQLDLIKRRIETLHEDLQYDYMLEWNDL